MKRFKHLSNKGLVEVINDRYANGLNDDDYVAELDADEKIKKSDVTK